MSYVLTFLVAFYLGMLTLAIFATSRDSDSCERGR